MKDDIKLASWVVANWAVCSGTPCIAGRRVPTSIIAGRFGFGETIGSLADDYDLTVTQIEAAIRYEFNRRRKRKPEFRATKPA